MSAILLIFWLEHINIFSLSLSVSVGMLLEMEPAALIQMLSDHAMLEVAVQKAQAALQT